jgi:hypothetical protein
MKAPPLLLLATVALFGCDKPASENPDESPRAPRVSVMPHDAAPIFAPDAPPEVRPGVPREVQPAAVAVAPATLAPVPDADSIAPPGVYFLLAQTSIVTDDGVTGLKAGTRLELKSPGEYMDGAGHVLRLGADQVTNKLPPAGRTPQADGSAELAAPAEIAQPAPPPSTAPVAGRPAPIPTPSRPSPLSAFARPATPSGEKPTFGSGPLGATHSSDTHDIKVDNVGRYWTDIRGRKHYLR